MSCSLTFETFLFSKVLSWSSLVISLLGAVFGHVSELLTLETSYSLVSTSFDSLGSFNFFILALFGEMTILLAVVAFDDSVSSIISVVFEVPSEVFVLRSFISFSVLSWLGTINLFVACLVAVETCLVLHL